MKAMLTSGVALVLLTGAALAQAADPGPAPAGAMPAPAPMAGPAGAPPPPPAGPGMARPLPGGPGGMADRGPGGPDGHRPPPPPPRGAHIHLQRGDLVLDVKCPDDEAMASCSDAALRMLDRMQATPTAK